MANYNAMMIGLLLKALKSGGTCVEIANSTGLGADTVRKYTRKWHSMGVVYVSHWIRDKGNGKPMKVFRLQTGAIEDAKKPTPLTSAEREDRWRRRSSGESNQSLREELIKRDLCDGR